MISIDLGVQQRSVAEEDARLWGTNFCWFCLEWLPVRYLGPIHTPGGTAPVSGCAPCLEPRLQMAADYAAQPDVAVLNYPEHARREQQV